MLELEEASKAPSAEGRNVAAAAIVAIDFMKDMLIENKADYIRDSKDGRLRRQRVCIVRDVKRLDANKRLQG